MFLDEAVVEFVSGRGGNGAATFHREKHVPRGGPNGADGGRGGDVVLIADRGKRTLYDFKFHPKVEAGVGSHASGNKRGKDGASVEVRVPVGTLVTDAETGEILADLSFDGAQVVLCKGGRGGFGNLHFVNSVRQVPTFAEKGAPGETIRAKLELKLLADIGLIGMPNAGKSTLISRISAAKPKIADYPFTTIEPNLGVVDFAGETFTVADMPGLIEGAGEGHGLGRQFLKHVERTVALVHVVEALPLDESSPVENFRIIEKELKGYDPELAERPRLVALNKIDLLEGPEVDRLAGELASAAGQAVFPISAVSGQGLEPLLYAMIETLRQAPRREAAAVTIKLGRRDEENAAWEIVESTAGFRVMGKNVERMAAMTDLTNDEAIRQLHRRLSRMGVLEKLREMGAEEGDTVLIGEVEFAFEED